MAKRKKEPSGDLLNQPPAVPKAAAPEIKPFPKIVEYRPLGTGEEWRVERFEEFAAELDISPALGPLENVMVQFHEIGLRYPRQWLICRRLFGIGPMIIPADADPEDFEIKSRAEICAQMGIETMDLQAELDAMRAVWRDYVKREGVEEKAEGQRRKAEGQKAEAVEGALERELKFDDDILREFGFDAAMFEILVTDSVSKEQTKRSAEATRIEKEWFCHRLKEWAKMLREPMAGALAREALINELYLRRMSDAMVSLEPGSSRWKNLYGDKQDLETQLKEQLSELQGMFPESATVNRERFRWVFSEVIKAYQEYYGRNDRRLVDRIFTAAEIEVMVRQSLQAPEPRYRMGLNIAIVEAMNGLYDPNWRSVFKHGVLKKLDAGFKEGVMKMRETLNEPLVDLEKGVLPGEGDEFEDLKMPNENQEEVITENAE